jgi:periplasmic protein CpxP/Spy
MKSIRNMLTATLITAVAALTAETGMSAASAADESTTSQPPPGPNEWHQHGGPWHLLGKLGLSGPQQQQIKDIMAAARPEMQSLREQLHANAAKLKQVQPTDPNYASIASQVSQTHGALSTQLMAQRAALRAQVFKVLTPAQQVSLATLEADKQAHRHSGGREPSF